MNDSILQLFKLEPTEVAADLQPHSNTCQLQQLHCLLINHHDCDDYIIMMMIIMMVMMMMMVMVAMHSRVFRMLGLPVCSLKSTLEQLKHNHFIRSDSEIKL